MKNRSHSIERDYFAPQAELILSSFYNVIGKHLIDPQLSKKERYKALYEAPFCVVSHDTSKDPIFNYGNKAALELFEFNWKDFTALPSRLSAESQVQEERDRLLKQVTENGFIDDYQGVRVSSSGKRFFVKQAIVWNLFDTNDIYQGQAAVLYEWHTLDTIKKPFISRNFQ